MNHQYIEIVGDTDNFYNLNKLNDNGTKTDIVLHNEYYNGMGFSIFMWILILALCFNFCKAIQSHNAHIEYQRHRLNNINTNPNNDLPNYTVIQNKIIKIKEYEFNNELEHHDKCSICLEDYEENDIINVLKCGHKYHDKCIDEWIITNINCPLCRLSI